MPFSDDLEVNLKLMDGSPDVVNYASMAGRSQLEVAKSKDVMFVESDGGNIVCSGDMFFNADEKKCTTFPYATDVPIVYRVINDIQHGH